jgi:hypothetical protein
MEREAVTIHFPADLLVQAKKLKFVSESSQKKLCVPLRLPLRSFALKNALVLM